MTHFWSYTDTTHEEAESRFVFGSSKPPDQYEFAFVPRNAEVLGLVDSTPIPGQSSDVLSTPFLRSLFHIIVPPVFPPKLSSSFNLVKGMVALLQLLYTSSTLYRTGGGQVNRYGFAAPGLTVLPYAVMSALNFVTNLVSPHYPTLYLVRSKVMEEAERRTGLSFHYVVGRVVEESGTNSDNIIMEGWSEIAGTFKDDNNVLHVTHSAEEDKKIELSYRPGQKIYVPACPRFQRKDDTQTSPLRQFNEIRRGWLEFPRYLTRRQQALIQPSLFSLSRLSSQLHSCVQALRPHIHNIRLPQRSQRRQYVTRGMNSYEVYLVAFISGAEFFIMLALSNFNGQQSTLAQRAWIITWLFAGSLIVAVMVVMKYIPFYFDMNRDDWLTDFLIKVFVVYCLSSGAPAIGGFVVVSQMLKAYGICYKFV